MKQIIKCINDKGIEFRKFKYLHENAIKIIVEKDNIFINGFQEEMKWDRELIIYQDRYKKYILKETIGILSTKTHIETGKQKELVLILKKLLEDNFEN